MAAEGDRREARRAPLLGLSVLLLVATFIAPFPVGVLTGVIGYLPSGFLIYGIIGIGCYWVIRNALSALKSGEDMSRATATLVLVSYPTLSCVYFYVVVPVFFALGVSGP